MSARRALLRALSGALLCATACRSGAGASAPRQSARAELPSSDIFSFRLSRPALRARGASETLVDRIGASAYRYFRVLGEPFKHRTCEAFRDLRWRLPSGAVHGDAHLEQFVVTDGDYGLSDFDAAGYGPAIVDLVRYASSLHLACREIDGGCEPSLGARLPRALALGCPRPGGSGCARRRRRDAARRPLLDHLPGGAGGHQRFTQLLAFDLTEERARALARSLAQDVVAEWSRFREPEDQH